VWWPVSLLAPLRLVSIPILRVTLLVHLLGYLGHPPLLGLVLLLAVHIVLTLLLWSLLLMRRCLTLFLVSGGCVFTHQDVRLILLVLLILIWL
jgi:hypothetical protein